MLTLPQQEALLYLKAIQRGDPRPPRISEEAIMLLRAGFADTQVAYDVIYPRKLRK